MQLRFRHFQTRLLLFLLLPMLVVLLAVQQTVSRVSRDNAYNLILRDLQQTARSFEGALADRNYILATAGDVLWDDFGFKEAYGTRDTATIDSALHNLLGRLADADFIAFTDYRDETVLASTLASVTEAAPAPWPTLLDTAQARDSRGEYPEADDVLVLDGRPYHLALLPFFNPDLENWVTLGFEIDQDLVGIFRDSVAAEISVLLQDASGWRIHTSTLPDTLQASLLEQSASLGPDEAGQLVELQGETWVTLVANIGQNPGRVRLLLQRSLAAELQPYEVLERRLLEIFAIGLVVLLAGLLLISRQVTRPVKALVAGAQRIAEGDYLQRVELRQEDEVGQLAVAFNAMAQGLAEKERVRALLGKVVSPEIANELLSRDVELGGEEREVSILFADVRGFTSLCEGQSPQGILALLNEYFSAVTAVIEAEGGVVDKYIGDAVMALFGAPLSCSDAPARAVRAALGMQRAVASLNRNFAARGLKPIDIGVGVHSDRVVVGNMGSSTRLNYTAIGDGVNLASRLEGLTKYYGVALVVSAQTAALAPGLQWLELDRVRVKGKQEAVHILEALPPDCDASMLQAAAEFRHFLAAWVAGDFVTAQALLAANTVLAAQRPGLVQLYHARLQQVLTQAPRHWDGIHSFETK
jgi:adenylate cyclase